MKRLVIGILMIGMLLGCAKAGTEPFAPAEPTGVPAEQVVEVQFTELPTPQATPIPTPTASPTPTPSPTPEPTPTPTPSPTPIPTSFTIAWISDTQGYTFRDTEGLDSIVNYILENREALNIAAVVQTGDLVERHEVPEHWERIETAFAPLRGVVPFYCVAGNHDVGFYGYKHLTYQYYLEHSLCDVKEEDQIFEDGKCWYDLREDIGLLLIGIGWMFDGDAPRFVEWAGDVLDRYSDYPALIVTHSFIYTNGLLSSDGEYLEKELISQHPNARLVVCGHHDGARRWSRMYEDGRTFHAMMLNFQDDKNRSRGYFTLLTFDPLFRNISVTTYSPFFDDYNYSKDPSKETFILEKAF